MIPSIRARTSDRIAAADAHLAAYALRTSDSGGRVYAEPDDPLRSPLELDRHRIVECTAFRRLEHKTQVFLAGRHDHFRTRLTHTLEVSQVARCLAAALRANEALAECITLAHDLGHPPFGHAGEVALNEAMAHAGGFNHNTHSLRVVDFLEHPFPAFRGLNLTAATRAGLLSHETRYDKPQQPDASSGVSASSSSGATIANALDARSTVESQIASLADRIAYNIHDLEDAIGAQLVTADELMTTELWRSAYAQVAGNFRQANLLQVRRVVLDRMLDTVLSDVVEHTARALARFTSAAEVRACGQTLAAPSESMDETLRELEGFLLRRVYHHPEVAAMDAAGKRMVIALFSAYRSTPSALPSRYAARIDEQGADHVICDYIAGMTDGFCTREHQRLVTSTWNQ